MLPGVKTFQRAFAPQAALRWPNDEVHRICVVLAGSFVEQRHSRDMTFARGAVVFRPASERNPIRFGPRGMCSLTVEVSRAAGDEWFEAGVLPNKPLDLSSPECHRLALRAASEIRSPHPSSQLIVTGLLLEIIGRLGRSTSTCSNEAPYWLAAVVRRVRDESRIPRPLTEYASSVGVHPVTLAKAFRTYQGCTIGDFVRTLRLECAAKLLVETKSDLAHVALESGFADQPHMTRWFRRCFGTTPSGFRRNWRRS